MRSLRGWSATVALLLATPGLASAAPLVPPTAPSGSLSYEPSSLEKPSRTRFEVGTLFTHWDVSGFSLGPRAGKVDLNADPSPLLLADYFITKRLSIGGWYNPLSLEAGSGAQRRLTGSADFWDFHATYRLRRGWSAQIGVSHISQSFTAERDLPGKEEGTVAIPKGTRLRGEKGSVNFWGSKTQQIRRGRHPVVAYASLGYYESEEFERAVNFIVGGSYQFSRHLSLSGSAWFFNVTGQVETRATVGILGHF